MKPLIALLTIVILISACNNTSSKSDQSSISIDTLQGKSLFGDALISKQIDPVKDSSRISKFLEAKSKYIQNPDDPEAIVWYGRRMAYLGDFLSAIDIFTEGINKFPKDARFYRHRGHRYISIREYDKAIVDFEKAANLIKGKEDVIEPDGMPNVRNTPVSSLNTNIWYHLGLAYYLKGEMQPAEDAFQKSLSASTNPDMIAASGNWYYYNGDTVRAKEIFTQIMENGVWAGFAFLSAEADLFRME